MVQRTTSLVFVMLLAVLITFAGAVGSKQAKKATEISKDRQSKAAAAKAAEVPAALVQEAATDDRAEPLTIPSQQVQQPSHTRSAVAPSGLPSGPVSMHSGHVQPGAGAGQVQRALRGRQHDASLFGPLEQKADILAAGIKLGEVLGEVLEAWPKEAIGSLGDHHSMEAILHSLTSKQGMLDAKVNLDKAMTAVEHALKELDDATGDTYHWVDAKNRANQAQAHLIATQKQAVVAANEAKAAVLDAKNRANLAVRNVDREVKWQEGTVQHLKKELGKEEVKVVKAKKAHQEAKPGPFFVHLPTCLEGCRMRRKIATKPRYRCSQPRTNLTRSRRLPRKSLKTASGS